MIRKLCVLCLLAFVVSAGSAAALPLSITNVGGLAGNGWINPVSTDATFVQNQNGQLTDSLFWNSADLQSDSGYQFTPVNPANPIPLGAPLLLGNFVHINKPIPGDGLSSVQYSFGFSTNGAPSTVNTVFQFNHFETNNSGPCPTNPISGAASISVCDDFVSILNLDLDALVTVGTDSYFFNLLGFSTDGGQTFSSVMQTQEEHNNRSSLYGIVTSQPGIVTLQQVEPEPVPEPATLLMLGAGLAVVARQLKKRNRSSRG